MYVVWPNNWIVFTVTQWAQQWQMTTLGCEWLPSGSSVFVHFMSGCQSFTLTLNKFHCYGFIKLFGLDVRSHHGYIKKRRQPTFRKKTVVISASSKTQVIVRTIIISIVVSIQCFKSFLTFNEQYNGQFLFKSNRKRIQCRCARLFFSELHQCPLVFIEGTAQKQEL